MEFNRAAIEAAINEAFKVDEPLTEAELMGPRINEAAPKMRKDFYVEKLRLLYEDIAQLDKQMSHADSSRYSHVKKDFNKALKAVAELTNTLNRKGETIPK